MARWILCSCFVTNSDAFLSSLHGLFLIRSLICRCYKIEVALRTLDVSTFNDFNDFYDCCFLGCNTMWRWVKTGMRRVENWRRNQNVPANCWHPPTRLHRGVTQNTVICIFRLQFPSWSGIIRFRINANLTTNRLVELLRFWELQVRTAFRKLTVLSRISSGPPCKCWVCVLKWPRQFFFHLILS